MRVLKAFMARRGGTVLVGNLPDEFRIDGKADFDGILAKQVAEHGLNQGTKEARKIFRRAIREASDTPAADLFAAEGRLIIEWKVEQFFHVPSLPIGDKREMKLAQRFGEYDAAPMSLSEEEAKEDDEDTPKPGAVDRELADAFEAVIGCYYLRKAPDKDRKAELLKTTRSLKKLIDTLKERLKENRPEDGGTAELRGQLKILYARQAAAWERIRGNPLPISTYTLRAKYNLHTLDGNRPAGADSTPATGPDAYCRRPGTTYRHRHPKLPALPGMGQSHRRL